jgi:hypothetical protein
MGLLTDILEKKIEAKHQDEEERKRKMREFYYDRIHDDNTDPAVREQISGDYLKLLSPEAKKHAQQGLGVIGKLKAAFGAGPKQQQPAQPVPAPQGPQGPPKFAPGAADRAPGIPTVTSPAQGGEAKPQPDAKQQFMAGPPQQPAQPQFFKDYGKAPVQQKLDTEKQEYDAWLERGKKLNLEGSDLAEYAGSKGARLPAVEKRIADKGVARPGEDPATGKPYEGLWDHIVDPKGEDTWAKRPDVVKSSGMIRSVPHSVSVADAKATSGKGAVYKDQQGNDIDIDKLPPNMGLQAMVSGDKMFWVPISPTQTTMTIGNEVYTVTPYDKNVAGGAGIPQGPARVGTTTQGQTTVYNPDSKEFERFPTKTTSEPTTTGARPTAPPATAPTAGGAPRPAVAPSAASPVAAPRTQSMGNRIPAGQRAGIVSQALPVQEATIQLFGDPLHPELKGLKDYSSLADSKESQQRIGRALNLIFNGFNDATKGSGISADAGPISVNSGGIGAVLQNYFGVPQELAKQQSEIMAKAIGDLPPVEQDYVNSVVSSFGTITGLRSLSRASASQYTTKNLEREVPLIGVNTFDSRSFGDKLQRLSGVVVNGFGQLPKGAIDAKMRQRINQLPAEMEKIKQGSGPAKAPTPRGKQSNSIVEDLVRDHATSR